MKHKSNKSRSPKCSKRAYLILCLFVPFLAAVSCSDKTLSLPEEPEPEEFRIGFAVRESASRGIATDMNNIRNIGVYGYYTGKVTWDCVCPENPTLTADYFCNTELRKAEGWSYSPPKYWPVDPDDMLSFIAYSPFVATADISGAPVDLTGQPMVPYPGVRIQTGIPKIDYTVPAAIREQIDLLWDARLNMRSGDAAPVAFNMKHALTSIRFSAQFASEDEIQKGYKVSVNKITLSNVYTAGTLDLGSGRWSFHPNAKQDGVFVLTGSDLSGAKVENTMDPAYWIAEDAGTWMMLPQDLSSATLIFDLEFESNSGVKTFGPVLVDLIDHQPWTAGKEIEYQILIRGDYIVIQTIYSDHWRNGGNGTGAIEL